MGIGPSTKETTLHHFRDPLLEVVSEDTDLDLLGILLVGTPDGNEEKMFVGTRAAVMAECREQTELLFPVMAGATATLTIRILWSRSVKEEFR